MPKITRLPASFLSRAPGHTGNLPRELSSFVGRQTQVEDVAQTLRTSGLVTLVGIGGVGKTRLALRVAAAVRANYAYGAWLVELAPVTDAAHLATAVAAAVGVRERPGSNPLNTLRLVLRHRQLLLVLDNCEHLSQGCAELVTSLLQECDDLTVLATSREPLGVTGEAVHKVLPLGVPDPNDSYPQLTASDAVQLLVARVQASDATFALSAETAPQAGRVCRLLEGVPLAIELAAARAKSMTLSEIAIHLDDPLSLLTIGSRSGPPRHQTLRATIDWSYELLTDREQTLLRRLAVFPGGFTVDSARTVCAEDADSPGELQDLLHRLTGHCFLTADTQREQTRFRMLESVRQYCLQQLEASGEAMLLRVRLSDWCLALATSVPPEKLDPAHVARMEPEIENLRYALRWVIETRQLSAATRLALGLTSFWHLRGSFAEGRAALTAVLHLASTGTRNVPMELPHAGTWAATMAANQGDYTDAERYSQQALDLARTNGNKYAEVFAYNQLGWLALLRGEPARARLINERALSLLSPGCSVAQVVRMQLALVYIELGESTLARDMLDGFLSGTYSRTLVGRILAARALLAEQAGDYSAADRLLETAIASEREIGDEPGLIESLTLRGVVAIARGARQLAAETLAEAFGIASMFGSKNRLAPLIEALACLASSAQPAVSVELAAAARCLRQSLGAAPLPSEQARVQRYLNVARRRIGEAAYTEISREAAVVPLEATLARGRQFLHAFMSEPPGAARAAGTDTLSDREREVAMLVVRGCSNRQIAEELFITQKTVETHVSHVLTKLGLTSRVQIATWGLRHGASPPNGEPAMSAG